MKLNSLLIVMVVLSIVFSQFFAASSNLSQSYDVVHANSTALPMDRWMGTLASIIHNRSFIELILPGTHDSGSYWLSSTLAPDAAGSVFWDDVLLLAQDLLIPVQDVITPWAVAQPFDVYTQLRNGARYVDVRAAWDGFQWRTFHFELGNKIESLLLDISRFLFEQPSEIVIVELSHMGSGDPNTVDYQDLMNLVLHHLGPRLCPRAMGFLSYSQMMKRGFNVVLTFSDSAAIANQPLIWPASAVLNTYSNTPNIHKMVAYNLQQASYYSDVFVGTAAHSSTIYKLSWTLTPTATTIVEAGVMDIPNMIQVLLLPNMPQSLQQLAQQANQALKQWLVEVQMDRGIGNVMIFDHLSSEQALLIAMLNVV